MKRAALLFLIAAYIVSCLGISVSRIYCCGKLTSTTFSYGAAENNTKKDGADKCCGHEKQSFKVRDSHFSASSISFNHPVPAILPLFIGPYDDQIVSASSTQLVYKGNAPPGHSHIPFYTLNCSYRI